MKKLILAVLVLLSSVVTSNATTITFDALEQAGTGYNFLSTYSEKGFLLDSGAQFGSAQQGNSGWYLGSASLFNNYGGGTTTLTKIGGGAFSLNSIDLAPVSIWYGTGATVSFIGNLLGGGTVSQSFTLSNPSAFETFAFSGFDNLNSVSWSQISPFHQFDNLVLDQTAPVPEPGTITLLGLGLAGLAVYGKRRKSSQA